MRAQLIKAPRELHLPGRFLERQFTIGVNGIALPDGCAALVRSRRLFVAHDAAPAASSGRLINRDWYTPGPAR